MSSIVSTSVQALANVSNNIAQYLPEPTSSGIGVLRDAVSAVSGSLGDASSLVDGDFASLIQLQLEAQREMQATTMLSNIEHTKHETKMAAIRNIRVG